MTTLRIDASNHRLRRVGRVARRRMRIEGGRIRNGVHTDGQISVELSGVAASGQPTTAIRWQADRPVALVIVRSGDKGEGVLFRAGPFDTGTIEPSADGEGGPIGYIAFCYGLAPEPASGPLALPPVSSILAELLRSGAPA